MNPFLSVAIPRTNRTQNFSTDYSHNIISKNTIFYIDAYFFFGKKRGEKKRGREGKNYLVK